MESTTSQKFNEQDIENKGPAEDMDIASSNELITIDEKIELVLLEQQNQIEREYRELTQKAAEKRISNTQSNMNSSLMSQALALSNSYKNASPLPESRSGTLAVLGKTAKTLIKPFVKEKAQAVYIESQAGLHEQILELDKRISKAIEEINLDVSDLINTRIRLEEILMRAGDEIDNIKILVAETKEEVKALEAFVEEYKDSDVPEVNIAQARIDNLRHSIVRLDRRLYNKQSQLAHISVQINQANDEIDNAMDQSENMKSTRHSLMQLIDSASISAAEDRLIERAKINSRIQDGINQTLIHFQEKSGRHAEQIARQAERPTYSMAMIKRTAEIRQSTAEAKEKIVTEATMHRQEARAALAGILRKEIQHSGNVKLVGSSEKMESGLQKSLEKPKETED